MGNVKCSCMSKTKNYIDKEIKKRKKPPKPEEIKIEEGVKNADGKVLTESMRLNMSETHSENKKKHNTEGNAKNLAPDKGNLGVTTYIPKSGPKINQSGILNSEYKHVSQIKKV